MDKFKRIKRHYIEYIVSLIILFAMLIGGFIALCFVNSVPDQEWLVFVALFIGFGPSIAYLFYVFYQYLIMYKNIKRLV